MNGAQPLGSGEPEFCDDCGDAYREVSRLPGTVGLCPTCFEAALGGGK